MGWRTDTVASPTVRDGGPGDDAAARFERLYDRHYSDILHYALRRMDQPEHAADAVADTFLTAWRRIDDVPAGPDARPWLFGVARRAMANQRRSTRRRNALVDRLGAELGAVRVTPSAASDLALSEVGRVFRTLSGSDRETLTLSAWEGLDTREIAVALDCSHAAARVRLHRARRRFARALRAAGVDVEPHLGATRQPALHTVVKGARRPAAEPVVEGTGR